MGQNHTRKERQKAKRWDDTTRDGKESGNWGQANSKLRWTKTLERKKVIKPNNHV